MRWYRQAFTHYADFHGRASRPEYWMFTMINYAIATVLTLLFALAGPIILTVGGPGSTSETIAVICAVTFLALLSLYALAVFLPGLAVTVRRLHDIDRSGLWALVSFIPFVGVFVLLVLLVLEGTRGPNRYGPDPETLPGPHGPYVGYHPGGQPPAGLPAPVPGGYRPVPQSGYSSGPRF